MENTISISRAARILGVTVKTLQRWEREGRLIPVAQTATNRRVYTVEQMQVFQGIRHEKRAPWRIILYCRVSSPAQEPALVHQQHTLEQFCAAKGFVDVEVMRDIGGGLNFQRKHFLAVMHAVEQREVKTLVLAHKDRLVRFGFDWFAAFCRQHGCEVVVPNQDTLSPEQEMVQDLMTIVQCFRSRLYGLRTYRKVLIQALKDPS